MGKRILSLILSIAMVLGSMCFVYAGSASVSSGGLNNFTAVRDYNEGQFTDVKATDWFSTFVASAYRMNLMSGSSATTFNANGNVSIAETITVAAKLHSIYYTGTADRFEVGNPWYMPYVQYALDNGIISSTYADYKRPATRSEYATILSAAFPDEALPVISEVDDNAIPDVPMTRSYAAPVYRLYRAGVLAGSDAKGTFHPDSNIKRSEVATILIKFADKSQRKETTFKVATSLSAVQVSEKCASAVFYIEVYGSNGTCLGTGSGFFINSDGTAVTNYHVIDGATYARIMLSDGTVKDVAGIYDWSEEYDLALLKIAGQGYNHLELETSPVVAGQTVYAIGSPRGLDNTISQGIVSNIKRTMGSVDHIQFTAPISHGNSGGALLNDSGKVIGIPSSFLYYDATDQNLNLAIPVSYISKLTKNHYSNLAEVFAHSDYTGSLYLSYGGIYDMGLDQGMYLPVYYDANTYITIVHDNCNEDVVDIEWGEFQDGWIPLNIESLKLGVAKIVIELYDSDETVLLDSKTITINVIPASIELSVYDGVLGVGEWAFVNATFYAPLTVTENFIARYEIEDDTIAEGEWGDWDGCTLPLYLHGLKRGETWVKFIILDDNENFVYSEWMKLTVQ